MDNQNNSQDGSLKDLWLGILISIGLYVGGMIALTAFGLILAFIAHIVIMIICFQKGRRRMGQGLLIGFGLVILLMAACFGYFFNILG